MKKRIVVGATGASGQPLLIKCLEIIRESEEFESYLIMDRKSASDAGIRNNMESRRSGSAGRSCVKSGRNRSRTGQWFVPDSRDGDRSM